MSQPRKRSPNSAPAEARATYAAEAESTHEMERGHDTPAQAAAEAQTVAHGDGDIDWQRPSSLDAPPPRPGYRQRWKRHRLGNAPDTRNWQRALREGWRARPVDTVDDRFASMKSDAGVIEAEGLILCEMPDNVAAQRAGYYRAAAERQIASVDHDLMRAQSAGGPAIEKNHQSRLAKGRRPDVAES